MHERKTGGQRTDKKNERMKEDVKARHEAATPKRSNDQKDMQTFKPGSSGDKNSPQNRGK